MHRLLSLVLLVALSGCALGDGAEAALHIERPLDGATLSTGNVRVEGAAPNGGPVVVNGVEATLAGGSFGATLRLGDGEHLIEAVGPVGRDEVRVVVDTIPPAIVIEEPTRASYIRGGHVIVSGRIQDDNPAELTVDGAPETVFVDGSFRWEGELPAGAHRLELVATDAAGNRDTAAISFLSGTFGPGDGPVRRAIVLGVGPDAFGTMGELLTRQVADALYDVSGGGGDLRITGITYRALDARVTPEVGAVRVTLTLDDMRVYWRSDDGLGGHSGQMTARRVLVDAALGLAVEDGALTTRVLEPRVSFDGFALDVDGVLGFLSDYEWLQEATRATLEEQIGLALAAGLEALAGKLVSLADRAGTGADDPEFVLGGVESAPTTGLRIELDLLPGAEAASAHPEAEGYVLSDRLSVPTGDDVVLGIGLDAVNAVLYRYWQAGSLSIRMESLDAASLAVLVPDLADRMAEASEAAIVVDTLLPPTVVHDAAGQLRVVIPDLDVRAETADGADVFPLLSLGLVVDATVRIDDGRPLLEIRDSRPVAVVSGGLSAVVQDLLVSSITESLAGVEGVVVGAFPEIGGVSFSSLPRVTDGYVIIDGALAP